MVARPFRRTFRQLADGSYRNNGNAEYVKHAKYAVAPAQYVRAYFLLQKDLLALFDYVEPADLNATTYSYRIHELLLRACIEVEANCKAILQENGYAARHRWNMVDYHRIEATHRLSSYRVKFPLWHGQEHTRQPFAAWGVAAPQPLPWYDSYNDVKHDRNNAFVRANLDNLMGAVSGLVALLASQFGNEEFSASADHLVVDGPNDGFEDAIGGQFRVQYPTNWPAADRYDFAWHDLWGEPDPFRTHAY